MSLSSSKQKKTGLVFCHGHAHHQIDSFYYDMADWIYLDIDENAQPDIVASLYDPENISEYLKRTNGKLFDYVLVYYCPIIHVDFNKNMLNALIAVRRALNENGKFIFHAFIDYMIGRIYENYDKCDHPNTLDAKIQLNKAEQRMRKLIKLIDIDKVKYTSVYDSDSRRKVTAMVILESKTDAHRTGIKKYLSLGWLFYDSILEAIAILDDYQDSLKREICMVQIKGEDTYEYLTDNCPRQDSILGKIHEFAKTLTFEAEFHEYGYLNNIYRPRNHTPSADGSYDQLYRTLVFKVCNTDH
jgi:hypothetical protein